MQGPLLPLDIPQAFPFLPAPRLARVLCWVLCEVEVHGRIFLRNVLRDIQVLQSISWLFRSSNPFRNWGKRNDILPSGMSDLSNSENSSCLGLLHPKAIQGMELFNARLYFEAHEALEAAWQDESSPLRDLYLGILQVGVVYLQITRHNYSGAINVYHRCQKWLQPWPETCRGVSVGQLRKDLETAISALQVLGPQHIAEYNMSLLKPIHYSKSENP